MGKRILIALALIAWFPVSSFLFLVIGVILSAIARSDLVFNNIFYFFGVIVAFPLVHSLYKRKIVPFLFLSVSMMGVGFAALMLDGMAHQ